MTNTKIYSSMSTKGGVGKTTLVKYLSLISKEELNENGEKNRVLIIDMCQNGDVASRLGYNYSDFQYYIHDWMMDRKEFHEVVYIDETTGLHFIPANEHVEDILKYVDKNSFDPKMALKEKIQEIEHLYDVIFIDTHPAESNIMLSMAIASSDKIVIPSKLDYSAVSAMERTIELVERAQRAGFPVEYQVVAMDVDVKMKRELKNFQEFLQEKGLEEAPVVQRSIVVEKASFTGEDLSKSKEPYAVKVMDGIKSVSDKLKGDK